MMMLLSPSISLLSRHVRYRSKNSISIRKATEVYCPDKTLPRRSSLLPHPSPNLDPLKYDLPPYVYHIKCEKVYNNIEECINHETKLELSYIKELLSFGAVYISSSSSSAAAKKKKKVHSDNKHSDNKQSIVKVDRYFNNSKTKKIDIGTYIRVHVNPRRHTAVYEKSINWKSLIHIQEPIANKESLNLSNNTLNMTDLIIVDKPANVPHVPTVDNYIENLWYQVMLFLKTTNDIYITSRLDTCTSGTTLFTKNVEAASLVNKAIRNRNVKKVYKALILKPIKLGLISHSYRKVSKNHVNGKPSLLRPYDSELINQNDEENWIEAELEIISCTKLSNDQINMNEIKHHIKNIEEQQINFYECEINLITGRTHQIRLQLAAEGSSLVGDSRYMPVTGLLDDCNLGNKHGDGTQLMGPDPKRIGLQCASLSFPNSLFGISPYDEYQTWNSSTPWWRKAN